MGKRSLHYRLNARETGAATWPEQNPVLSSARQPLDLLRHTSGHAALVRRLTQTSVLSGHEATVTAVSWNEPGTHLISSSDDCRVKIWDVQRSRMLRTIETGHTKSIYSIKFMPDTNDHYLLSCSADKEIRVVNLHKQAVRPFHCHHDRVKAVVPLSSFEFMSAGDSGKVCHHDTRLPVCPCDNSVRSRKDCSHLLLHQNSIRGSALGINALAVHPLQPHLFATGNNDAAVRLYDLRMLRRSGKGAKPNWVSCYVPQHMRTAGGPPGMPSGQCVTGISFNHNGTSLVASYARENIYSFDLVNHALGPDSPMLRRDREHPSWYGMLRPPMMRGSGRLPRRGADRSSQDFRDAPPASRAAVGGASGSGRDHSTESGQAQGAAAAGGQHGQGRGSSSPPPTASSLPADCHATRSSRARGHGPSGNTRFHKRSREDAEEDDEGEAAPQPGQSSGSALQPGFLNRDRHGELGQSAGASNVRETGPSGNTRGNKLHRRETGGAADGGSAQVSQDSGSAMQPEFLNRGQAETAQAAPRSFVFERLYRSESRGLQLRPRQGSGSAADDSANGNAPSADNSATQDAGAGGGGAGDARLGDAPRSGGGRRGGLFAGLNAALSPFDRSNSLLRRGLNAFSHTPDLANSGQQQRGTATGGTPDRGEESAAGAAVQPSPTMGRVSSLRQRQRSVAAAAPGEQTESGGRGGSGLSPVPRSRLGATIEDGRNAVEDDDGQSYTCCYKGHRNQSTTKGVTLLGGRSEFVVSGSDDGHVFVWDFDTGAIVNILLGDDVGVSCVTAHPHDPVLASAGAEDTVRIWSPAAQQATSLQDMDTVIRRNAQELAVGERPRPPTPVLISMLQGTGEVERTRRIPLDQSLGNCAIQ